MKWYRRQPRRKRRTVSAATVLTGLPVVPDFPSLVVQLSPNNPFDPNPSWVTLPSTDVLQVDITRGRTHEYGRFEAGTATILLDNRSRNYDPSNTVGAYYPNVDVMQPVRILAVYGTTTYPLYYGFAQSWRQTYPTIVDAETALQCVDAFGLLNLYKVSNNNYAAAVLADAPRYYYRLGDPPGSSVANDTSGNNYVASALGVTFGSTGALIVDVSTSASFDGSTSLVTIPSGAAVTKPANGLSVECWIKTNGVVPSDSLPVAIWTQGATSDGSMSSLLLHLGAFGTLHYGEVVFGWGVNGSGYGGIQFSPSRVDDSAWHHIVGTTADGVNGKVYVDGTLVRSGAMGGTMPALSAQQGGIGKNPLLGHDSVNFVGLDVFNGQIDELAVYTYELSAARISAHYTAGTPFPVQLSGQRVGAVLTAIGFPTLLRNVDTGRSNLQAPTAPLSSTTTLGYLQTVELTESGEMFVAADGRLTFFDRYHTLFNATNLNSQVTLGDNGVDEPYMSGPNIGLDDLDIYNEVVAQRANGVAQPAVDTASQTAYAPRTKTLSGMLHTNDNEVLDRANFELSRSKNAQQRVRQVQIHPRDDTTNLFPQVLGRELMDRVTVNRRPIGGGPVNAQVSYIEQIKHRVTPQDWVTTWATAPVSLAGPPDNTLVLDDATRGQLDANVLGY